MLNLFLIDSIDVLNVIFLWLCLTKKKSSLIKIIASIITISIFTAFSDYLGLNFIISYIITILVIKIIYNESFEDTILRFLVIIITDMLLQLILSSIINKFIENSYIRIISLELIELIIISMFYHVQAINNIFFLKISNRISISFISIFGIYAVIAKIIWNYDKQIILNNLYISISIIGILNVSQLLLYIYILKETREKEKLRVSSEYNNIITEIIQEIKRRQHDFINYKTTILGIVNVLDDKEIKPAIIKYMNDENSTDCNINKLIYIDNVIIRSIIYNAIRRADKYDIEFSYDIENNVLDTLLDYHELSNLLSNLLNNAFEEVTKEECLDKHIEIKIINKDDQASLSVKNSLAEDSTPDLNNIFKNGYSDKSKNFAQRGYGLYNVQQISKLHNGKIKIKIENRQIILNICFDKEYHNTKIL